MVEQKFQVTAPEGMHLRPTGILCNEAAKFKCEIKLKKGSKTVNGKSLLGILGTGIRSGDCFVMTFDGTDEENAASAVRERLRAE